MCLLSELVHYFFLVLPMKLFNDRFTINCMDLSSCEYSFSEDEIRRFLSPQTFERFDQLRTDSELRQVQSPRHLLDHYFSLLPLTLGLIIGWIGWTCLVPFLPFCGDHGAG